MSQIRKSHVTGMNKSCHAPHHVAREQLLAAPRHSKFVFLWMSNVPHVNESYHTYEQVISHAISTEQTLRIQIFLLIHVCYDPFLTDSCVIRPISELFICDMTHFWVIHMCDMSPTMSTQKTLIRLFRFHTNESGHTYKWVMSHI